MEENKIPLVKDAEALAKLTKAPIEVQVPVYDLLEDKETVDKVGTVKAYLHRLTGLERNHIRASATSVYRYSRANGADDAEAKESILAMIPRMTIYFALKNDLKPGSDRFFTSQELVLQYPFEDVVFDLYGRYLVEFNLTEQEWGNFVRARNSGTFSALPAISPEQTSSGVLSQN